MHTREYKDRRTSTYYHTCKDKIQRPNGMPTGKMLTEMLPISESKLKCD